MSDFKSKLPDLKELSSMTEKLFKGIKNSVAEIVQDYKQKRAEQEAEEKVAEAKAKTEETTVISSAPHEAVEEPTKVEKKDK